ncbi:hypothetical protein WR25_08922 [Diploscapter pachys]|uniref:ATP-dependent NAD(P)H-hydrate dehydratase n=1 Tax=Diploscapter pachys TaxID=2018661 RepID=A0A2A2LS46_9BILA|nr:hypothetical protein WR25_08922 [Diploscapter pachys]
MESFRRLMPKLTMQLRKGDMGKIAIIGGSAEYTGAPYYAAATVVNMGADLIYVMCAPEAAPIIKGYSPDLIVHPSLEPEFVIPVYLKER